LEIARQSRQAYPRLETWRVNAADAIAWDSDTINPVPDKGT
jgi:hypothetical protein